MVISLAVTQQVVGTPKHVRESSRPGHAGEIERLPELGLGGCHVDPQVQTQPKPARLLDVFVLDTNETEFVYPVTDWAPKITSAGASTGAGAIPRPIEEIAIMIQLRTRVVAGVSVPDTAMIAGGA